MLSRRCFLSGTTALAVAGTTAFAGTRPIGSDPAVLDARMTRARAAGDAPLDPAVRASRVAWLEQHAAELASIDFDDDNFDDLEAFGRAIGDARIVMLGEQSHGDGTTRLVHARLVRFLHEQMGFDVFAFESGLYSMRKVWERMRSGESARTVWRGLSATREMRPLVDYIGERVHRRRPLELAGVDCWIYGDARLLDDLAAFLAAHDVDTASIADWPRFRVMLEKVTDLSNLRRWKASAEEQRLVLSTIDTLVARIAVTRAPDAAFWRQVLKSTKAWAQQIFQMQEGDPTRTGFNLRDTAMADNLIWLTREAYPGRKIIVWAATFHIMRNPHLIDTRIPGFSYAEQTTMGHLAWQALGSAIYSVGSTAYEGHYGQLGEDPTPLSLPPPGSLEDLWGATKQQNAFLDLRQVAGGGEWLRAPLLSRPLGHRHMRADWCNVLDGMVFTRTMQPIMPAE